MECTWSDEFNHLSLLGNCIIYCQKEWLNCHSILFKTITFQIVCIDGQPEASSNNAAAIPKEQIESSVLIASNELANSQDSQNQTPASSSLAQNEMEACNQPSPVKVSAVAMPKTDSASILHQVQEYKSETASYPVATKTSTPQKDSDEDCHNVMLLENTQPQCKQGVATDLSLVTPVSINDIRYTTTLPSSSPVRDTPTTGSSQLQEHHPALQGNILPNPIIDPAAFCQENLQTGSGFTPFHGFPHHSTVDTLSVSGIHSFSQAQGMSGSLNNCMSNGLTGNLTGNVVYAAVPLQQTANGMQVSTICQPFKLS